MPGEASSTGTVRSWPRGLQQFRLLGVAYGAGGAPASQFDQGHTCRGGLVAVGPGAGHRGDVRHVAGRCMLTRSAAVLGSGSMAYAYFTVHQAAGVLPIVNGGEQAAVFCWSLLLLAVTGPGAYALGAAISARFRGVPAPAGEHPVAYP